MTKGGAEVDDTAGKNTPVGTQFPKQGKKYKGEKGSWISDSCAVKGISRCKLDGSCPRN